MAGNLGPTCTKGLSLGDIAVPLDEPQQVVGGDDPQDAILVRNNNVVRVVVAHDPRCDVDVRIRRHGVNAFGHDSGDGEVCDRRLQ